MVTDPNEKRRAPRRERREPVRREAKKETKKQERPNAWITGYMKDMEATPPPQDWVEAAEYHVNNEVPEEVEVEALLWRPVHVDPENRIIDQADLWIKALLHGKTYGVLCRLRDETSLIWIEGDPTANKNPW